MFTAHFLQIFQPTHFISKNKFFWVKVFPDLRAEVDYMNKKFFLKKNQIQSKIQKLFWSPIYKKSRFRVKINVLSIAWLSEVSWLCDF